MWRDLQRIFGAVKRHPIWSGIGTLIVLAKPIYAGVDFVSNLQFIEQSWPLITGFLDSGYGTVVSIIGGAGILGWSVRRGLKETAIAMPPLPTVAPQLSLPAGPEPPRLHKLYTAGDKERLGEAFYEISNLLMVDGLGLENHILRIGGAYEKAIQPISQGINKPTPDFSVVLELLAEASVICSRLSASLENIRSRYQAYKDDILDIIEDESPGVLAETSNAIANYRQSIETMVAASRLDANLVQHIAGTARHAQRPLMNLTSRLNKFVTERNNRIEQKRKILA